MRNDSDPVPEVSGRVPHDSAVRPRVTIVEPGDPSGTNNQNPRDLSLLELIREDLSTHGGDPTEPGFVALAVHRFGNWRLGVQRPAVRHALDGLYDAIHRGVTLVTGIDLECSTPIGRRVRFWHHGGVFISARAVGDDVCFRHNTTVGPTHLGADVDERPLIGHRVEIGVGSAILGRVEIGDDATIGANAVVQRSCLPGQIMVGVPARPLRRRGPVELALPKGVAAGQ